MMLVTMALAPVVGGLSPQSAEAWAGLPYAQSLLDDHACSRAPGACTVNTSDTFTGSGALGYPNVPVGTKRPVACRSCGHGSHMVPYLVGLYGARKVIEVGVCTGASVVSVLRTHGDSIDSYTAVDPWGERRCNPGCGCSSQMRVIAGRFPMLKLLQEYSVSGARRIPDGSVDLACIYVEDSRPEASANSPSTTPCQRQTKLRAASSLGQLRPIGRHTWTWSGWPATPASLSLSHRPSSTQRTTTLTCTRTSSRTGRR
jgi:hypothetical protein